MEVKNDNFQEGSFKKITKNSLIRENFRLDLLVNEDSKSGSMFFAQQNFLEIITGKKVTYKTQEIIAKCLKQFDLRLFEVIGGYIQEKNPKG